MKEICIINHKSTAAVVYGVETYINEYVYCLNNMGCRINLIELGGGVESSEIYTKEDGNVRTIYFPSNRQMSSDIYNKGVCRLLRFYIEDSVNLVFHFHCEQSESLLDCIKRNFPLSKSIYTVHFLHWSALLQGNISLFEKIIRNRENDRIKDRYGLILEFYKQEKKYLEKFDRIVCLSDDTLKMIQDQYGIRQNVHLIPNGLRKNIRNLSEKQKLKLREKFYIFPEEKILLFVGRFERMKGINPLMVCFDEVIRDYPDCRLVVIGAGDTDKILKNCKKSWTKVTFTGRLDKKTLYQWYQIADIALFPSFCDECSYVGIEMMMHGLPIVASDGYSVKNMFHDGVNAKIARIENWERKVKFEKNLKEAILELLNSGLTKSIIQKGAKKTYQLKYSIACMQKGYSEFFNSF